MSVLQLQEANGPLKPCATQGWAPLLFQQSGENNIIFFSSSLHRRQCCPSVCTDPISMVYESMLALYLHLHLECKSSKRIRSKVSVKDMKHLPEEMLKTHKVKTKPGFLVKIKNYLPPGRVQQTVLLSGLCLCKQCLCLFSDSRANYFVKYLQSP